MNFVGHHAGTLLHPTYYPSIPRQPMRIFDEPIWSVKSSTVAISGYQTDEEREIIALKERVRGLQTQLDTYDRLFRFAGRISKKLICIGQMSDAEIISALKFGIDIRLDTTRWSFRLPVWKIDNFTEVDEDFLRLIGELKDFKDVSCQYPAIEEEVEDSTIMLHKGEDLFSENSDSSFLDEYGRPTLNMTLNRNFGNTDGTELLSSDSLFGMKSLDDTHLMTPYINQMSRIERIKSSTSQRMREALASARDITRIASEIAQHVANANNSKIALVGTLSEAKGDTSDSAIAVEPQIRPSTKNRDQIATGIPAPVRVQVPLPRVTSAITIAVQQENVKHKESLGSLSDRNARPTTSKGERKCRSKAAPKVKTVGGLKYQANARPKDKAIAGPSTGPKVQAIVGPSTGPEVHVIAGLSTGPQVQPIAGTSTGPEVHVIAGLSAGSKVQPIAGPSTGSEIQPIAGPSTGSEIQPIAGPSAGPKIQGKPEPNEKRTGAKSCDHVTHAKGKIIPPKTHTPFKCSRPKVTLTKGVITRRVFNRTMPLPVAEIPMATNPPTPANPNIVPILTVNEN